jgi:hypothetical protein
MGRYRRRIAMLSVSPQLGCPVRRRIEGEIEIARPVEIVFETTRSHTPTRFFFSRVLQPFVVKLLGKTVYQDMRRMEELFRNSNHHSTIAKPNGACGDSCLASTRSNATRASTHRPAVSADYPWARFAHPSPRPFGTCLLITSLLILVWRYDDPAVETRVAARTSGAGEAGEHRDLCLGVARSGLRSFPG